MAFFSFLKPKFAFDFFRKGMRRIRKDSQTFLSTISKLSFFSLRIFELFLSLFVEFISIAESRLNREV